MNAKIERKKGHATFLSESCFLVFNLIFLSIVACLLLEIGFAIHIFMKGIPVTKTFIQHILDFDISFITYDHKNNLYKIFAKISNMQNALENKSHTYLNSSIIHIFFQIIKITITRFYLFILFIPFICLILSLFIIDGLAERDKRKFQGARESTLFFHRLKPLAKFFFYLLFFAYMAIPLAFPPELLITPMAILSGLFCMLSIKTFKKYL